MRSCYCCCVDSVDVVDAMLKLIIAGEYAVSLSSIYFLGILGVLTSTRYLKKFFHCLKESIRFE